MDLVKEAIFLGFSGAAVMDTKELVFVTGIPDIL